MKCLWSEKLRKLNKNVLFFRVSDKSDKNGEADGSEQTEFQGEWSHVFVE